MRADALERLGSHLAQALGARDVVVTENEKLLLGGARSTSSLSAQWTRDGQRTVAELILKQDPLHEGGSLVPLGVAYEYDWYAAVHRSARVRVPEPLLVERSGTVLGSPFMLMHKLQGHSDPADIHGAGFDDAARSAIACDAFAQLGRIAGIDVDALGAIPDRGVSTTAATAWATELRYWEDILDTCSLGPLPMIRAAIRRLRRTPPPAPPRLAIVHGDFRLGNFLYAGDGVRAIVDWEMAHLGDPHEDLAWAMSPNWHWVNKDRVWGIADERGVAQLVAAWEAESGLRMNAESLRWWLLFNRVKGAALWLKGAHAAAHGRALRLDYILVHWALTHKESARVAQAFSETPA